LKDLIIVGAQGFGREVLSYATDIVSTGNCAWRIKGFLSDYLDALDNFDTGYPILGTIADHVVLENAVYICALGDGEKRLNIGRELQKKGAQFINLIHPASKIYARVKMGVGNIFCPCTGASPDTVLGDFNVFNTFSGIGHDSILGNGCTLSSYCDITASCKLGDGIYLGSHAVITPKRNIGDYAKISAGAVIFTHVKPGKTMIGNPAIILK
jgi:sugar O-acyltransferase (sialic acid O-acetyltransferase NeuD family)